MRKEEYVNNSSRKLAAAYSDSSSHNGRVSRINRLVHRAKHRVASSLPPPTRISHALQTRSRHQDHPSCIPRRPYRSRIAGSHVARLRQSSRSRNCYLDKPPRRDHQQRRHNDAITHHDERGDRRPIRRVPYRTLPSHQPSNAAAPRCCINKHTRSDARSQLNESRPSYQSSEVLGL
jgi:hypothetical protein